MALSPGSRKTLANAKPGKRGPVSAAPRVPKAVAAKAKKFVGRTASVGGIAHGARRNQLNATNNKAGFAAHREGMVEDMKMTGLAKHFPGLNKKRTK